MKMGNQTGGYEMASLSEVVDRKEFVARAEAYLEQDPARAVDLALERLRIYPDDTEAKIILGIGWYRRGEMEPALEVLRGIAEDIMRWSPVSAFCPNSAGNGASMKWPIRPPASTCP